MSIRCNVIFFLLFVSGYQSLEAMAVQGIYLHPKVGKPAAVLTTVMEFIETPITYKQMMTALSETKLDVIFQKSDLIGSTYTLFLPTDVAFDQFGRLGLLRSKENIAPDPDRQKKYEQFVKYHMLKNIVTIKGLMNAGRPLQTEAGASLSPDDIGEILFSVELKGGIVHVIKKVLINPELKDYLYPRTAR